jgi:peptidase E
MHVILLGPQRLQPILDQAVADVDRLLGVRGHLAVVTAGWEERELEIDELDAHVGGRARNLEIYHRVEDIFAKDQDLLAAMRQRHDALRELAEIYRVRLSHQMAAVRELAARPAHKGVSLEAQRAALAAVRALDAEHLHAVQRVHDEFEQRVAPRRRPHVQRHQREIARVLAECSMLCIAGGHVGVLLHRLRLFDVLGSHGQRPVIAWSAGAMVCSERVVLFHDDPPQGQGDAEVYEPGLGCIPGVVALPHARRRLKLDDAERVARLAQRFAPARAVALDERTRIDWDGQRLRVQHGTRELFADGSVREGAA